MADATIVPGSAVDAHVAQSSNAKNVSKIMRKFSGSALLKFFD